MLEFKCATPQRPIAIIFTRNGQQLNSGNRSRYIELNTFQTRALPKCGEFVSKKIFPSKSPSPFSPPPLSLAQCYVIAGALLLVIAVLCAWEPWRQWENTMPSIESGGFPAPNAMVSRTFSGDWSFLSAPAVLFFKGSPLLCHCLSLPLAANPRSCSIVTKKYP